jgi:poly(ADP-ribose) glycohydrolase ARH3
MGVDLRAKYQGGMLGSALGDAIGELAFRYPRKEPLVENVERLDKLVYTDDTAMALGLAESIIETGRVDQQNLGDTFSRNYQREPWRGYASGPPTIFTIVESQGISYVEAARSLFGGGGSLGNGAAMRIVPVGLFYHQSRQLYEAAVASAEVTHTHPVGRDGAAVQAWAVAEAVKLDPEENFPLDAFTEGMISFSRTPEIRGKMELVRDLILNEVSPQEAARRLGQTVAVHESMPFAIYSFLFSYRSFDECLFGAVLNGGDRDTLGAMACAISGAYLGVEAIPLSWRQKLEGYQTFVKTAVSLVEMSGE